MNTKGFKDARGSETINRILYMPTIFEHSAKLINKTPSKVVR